MIKIDPKDISVMERQKILTSGVGPRPIALVSTLSREGKANLSPFSFFNAFGANPPILAFSPARRGRDGSLKDTYFNVKDTKECVVAVVSYDMVEQISLASSEYDSEVDEFEKSGLTKVSSKKINSFGVKESPLWMECKVRDIIALGEENGSGNMVIVEVIMFHIADEVFEKGVLNPEKSDIVGRFGENYYVRASGASMFEVAKPVGMGIGIDRLPSFMKESFIYSANNLARFANTEKIPTLIQAKEFVESFEKSDSFSLNEFERYENLKSGELMLRYALSADTGKKELFERTAKVYLETNRFEEAWNVAIIAGS